MGDIIRPDRYEMRAFALEEGHLRRMAQADDPVAFLASSHEVEVLTIVEMFRKASRTYPKE